MGLVTGAALADVGGAQAVPPSASAAGSAAADAPHDLMAVSIVADAGEEVRVGAGFCDVGTEGVLLHAPDGERMLSWARLGRIRWSENSVTLAILPLARARDARTDPPRKLSLTFDRARASRCSLIRLPPCRTFSLSSLALQSHTSLLLSPPARRRQAMSPASALQSRIAAAALPRLTSQRSSRTGAFVATRLRS